MTGDPLRDRARAALAEWGAVSAADMLWGQLAAAGPHAEKVHVPSGALLAALAELDHLRSSLAAVRALHHLNERHAALGIEVCAGCATHVTHTPWPCKTIQALDLPVSPPEEQT